jgi:hypothetical protein
LREALATLEERGYPVEFAAMLVQGEAPDGGPLRAVRAVVPEGEAKEVVRLVLWGAQTLAIEIGLVDADEVGEEDAGEEVES